MASCVSLRLFCTGFACELLKSGGVFAAEVHMSANSGNAPAWLFSFLDLAFLILIAVLLTADGDPEEAPDLAAIELPEIQRSSTEALTLASEEPWQLRVHPRSGENESAPFVISRAASAGDVAADATETVHVDRDGLGVELQSLAARGLGKPFIAPHRDSRSEDFLTALGFVQEYWPEQHVAAVYPRNPRAETPAVSAAPGGGLLP